MHGHLQWIDEPEASRLVNDVSLPTDISMNKILTSLPQRMALAQLMRAPGLYDGCVDYVFERLIKVAVSLLFSDTDRFFLLKSTSHYPPFGNSPLPLIVVCEDYEGSSSMLDTMAKLLQPSLLQLVQLHRSKNKHQSTHDNTLPKHCILYGLHLSKLCLRIFAHFPLETTAKDSKEWKFCQVLVAEHWCGLEELRSPELSARFFMYSQEDCFLGRWRSSIALFAIRNHVWELEMLLNREGGYRSTALYPRIWDTTVTLGEVQPIGSPSEDIIQYIGVLRAFWRAARIALPAEWIPCFSEILSVVPTSWYKKLNETQLVRHLLLPLIKITLYPIRKILAPLPPDSEIPTAYMGPDFAHPIHMPRTQFREGEWDDVIEEKTPYLAHVYDPQLPRVYDILTAAFTTWNDLSMFLAYPFSGFHGLTVKWNPRARYPFEMETTPVHLLPDFAIAIQLIPPASSWNIDRLYDAPMTISSPAVVVCVQAQDIHMESEAISEDELTDLRNLMAPHLRVTSMGVGVQQCSNWPSWATLFTLYIKAGILHLMAFTLRWDGKKAQTDIYLVDSIPVRALAISPEDTQTRLRLAVALLTLRSHVYRFFERWSEIEWENSLVNGERLALNIATGMESRRGSSDGGSAKSVPDKKAWDGIIGQFVEAFGGMATELEEGSLETETAIVGSERYRAIKERIDFWGDGEATMNSTIEY